MAVVSVSTYLDLVTYAAGEVVTVTSDAILTIRKSTTINPGIISSTEGTILIDPAAPGGVSPIVIQFNATTQGFTVTGNGKLVARGGWHSLGTGTGLAAQTVVMYAGAHDVPFVQVETGSGTGVFVDMRGSIGDAITLYGPGAVVGAWFTQVAATTTLTFGTATNGFMPPSGAIIRVPNITITSAAIYTATAASRSNQLTNPSGIIDLENVNFSDRCYLNYVKPLQIRMRNVGCFAPTILSEAYDIDIDGLIISKDRLVNAVGATWSYIGGSNFTRIKVANRSLAVASGVAWAMSFALDCVFNNCRAENGGRGVNSMNTLTITTCSNLQFNNFVNIGSRINIATTIAARWLNLVFSDRETGTQDATNGQNILITGAGCDTIEVNGATLPTGGTAQNLYFASLTGTNNVRLFDINYNPNANSQGPFTALTNCGNITAADCTYTGALRVNLSLTVSTNLNVLMRNIVQTTGTALALSAAANVMEMSGITGLSTPTSYSGIYDVPYVLRLDVGTGTVTANIEVTGSAPSRTSYFLATSGLPIYNNLGGLLMRVAGGTPDQAVITLPNRLLGVTSFRNVAPVITGVNTANWTNEYSIATTEGSWGAWKTASAANLFAETLPSASVGFFMRFRFTCSTTSTTNSLTQFRVACNFDTTVKYPRIITSAAVNFYDVVVGSRLRVEKLDGTTIYDNIAAASTVSFAFSHRGTDEPIRYRVRKASAAPFYQPFDGLATITTSGLSIFTAQVLDA